MAAAQSHWCPLAIAVIAVPVTRVTGQQQAAAAGSLAYDLRGCIQLWAKQRTPTTAPKMSDCAIVDANPMVPQQRLGSLFTHGITVATSCFSTRFTS